MLTNPATLLYNQINSSIKNISVDKKPVKQSGLLGRQTEDSNTGELDMNKPVNRVTEYIRSIRKSREELNNGDES